MGAMVNRERLEPARLGAALETLGEVLAYRDQEYDLVLVGGANLVLQGVVARPTKDGGLIGERLENGRVIKLGTLPAPLAQAIADVAATLALDDQWLNLGPASLMDLGLPSGFEDRLSARRFGALTIWLAGHFDMVCFKLYASADQWPTRGRHLQDLQALRPNTDEIKGAAAWCLTHDPSPAFRNLLDAVVADLRGEDADGT
jgi:hypothetical protein